MAIKKATATKTTDIDLTGGDETTKPLPNKGEVYVNETKHPVAPSSEARLFQSKPHKKEWLTKDQAIARGHFWKD